MSDTLIFFYFLFVGTSTIIFALFFFYETHPSVPMRNRTSDLGEEDKHTYVQPPLPPQPPLPHSHTRPPIFFHTRIAVTTIKQTQILLAENNEEGRV